LTNIAKIIKPAVPKTNGHHEAFVNWLEDILDLSNKIASKVDELASNIYTPKEKTDNLNQNYIELKEKIITLQDICLSEQVSEIVSKIPKKEIESLNELKMKTLDEELKD